MPAFSLPQALHRPRHASFLYPDARHYLPGSLHVSGAPRCARPSGYRGRLRSAFLFSPRPLLSRGAPLLHGSMTDCLIAGENRAGLLLFSCSPPLPARFFPAPRRAALPPRRPLRLLCPMLLMSVWSPSFPCIPHSFKCASSGRIYPLVVQYF